ncbi:hypothetical protein K492DRAFT_205010 [Lichtheimia hyalospora FSU 10163]|nr:hypothetical protein K492DRAFT_205010 [Lichtheimia hyalospora FSU 10163]
MTLRDKGEPDIEPVQFHSAKELDADFASMLAVYRDKETEHNWEARDKSVTRLRAILRGDSNEKFHDNLLLGFRQMVDGIIKAVESLRTSLALNALTLVGEIGIYLGRYIDHYIYERLADCLVRCSTTTKKVIASASLKATTTFLRHANYYHKVMNMLALSMNEKNNQARDFTITYVKTILQSHAHRDQTRAMMDRSGNTEIIVKILTKGVNDATPAVRENCREAFWIFWEYWRERGENILKTLQPPARKALEKSKAAALASASKHRGLRSPTNSSSSLGSHRNMGDSHDTVSPSSSSASNGSGTSNEHHSHHDIPRSITRSISPRASSPSVRSTSPHLMRSTYGSPPPVPSQLHASYMAPSTSPPPPPATNATRKTRVPGLSRKKSTIGSGAKRKLSLMSMLNHDDLSMRCDGLHMLARKLASHPYSTIHDLSGIHIDSSSGAVDGPKLKQVVWGMFQEDNVRLYETLSSWEGVAGLLMKLVPFDEYIPKLILDASADAVSLKTEDDITKFEFANQAFKKVKIFLRRHDPDLAERLFAAVDEVGGLGTNTPSLRRQASNMMMMMGGKKDPMRQPAVRRKLTSRYLEWLDELVMPILGLDANTNEESEADIAAAAEWIGDAPDNVASTWFDSDAHVRQCLAKLLPPVSTSAPGSIVHAPLVSLVAHLRLVNQKLFEIAASAYDASTVNKISRVLGIHIRAIPDYVCQAAPLDHEPAQVSDVDDDLRLEQQQPIQDQVEMESVQAPITSNDEMPTDTNSITHDTPNSIPQQSPINETIPTSPAVTQPSISNETISRHHHSNNNVELDSQVTSPPPPDSHSPPLTARQHEPVVESMPDTLPEDPIKSSIPPPYLAESVPEPELSPEPSRPSPTSYATSHDTPTTPVYNAGSDMTTTTNGMHMDDLTIPISAPYHNDTSAHPLVSNNHQVNDISRTAPINGILSHDHDDDHSQHQGLNDIVSHTSPHEDLDHSRNIDFAPNSLHDRSSVSGSEAGLVSLDSAISPRHQHATRPTISTETSNNNKPPRRIQSTLTHVPYFAPKQVDDPLPVFADNKRSEANVAAAGRGGKDKTATLYAMVDKLKSASADNGTFRKLVRLAREASIIQPWDQGGANEAYSEVWAGADNNGGNFVELMQGILIYLGAGNDHGCNKTVSMITVLDLIRQLLVTQVGLFKYYERKVDAQGMSLEARLTERLLVVRANDDPSVSTGAEDALDTLLSVLEPHNAFDMIIAYLIHRLILAPSSEDQNNQSRYHPVGTAFTYLGKCVREVSDTFFVDEWLVQGGAMVFIRGMNHPMIHVRKSTVESIVEFQSILGDDIYQFLDDLRADQANLVKHYVSRAVKQRSSHSSFNSAPPSSHQL